MRVFTISALIVSVLVVAIVITFTPSMADSEDAAFDQPRPGTSDSVAAGSTVMPTGWKHKSPPTDRNRQIGAAREALAQGEISQAEAQETAAAMRETIISERYADIASPPETYTERSARRRDRCRDLDQNNILTFEANNPGARSHQPPLGVSRSEWQPNSPGPDGKPYGQSTSSRNTTQVRKQASARASATRAPQSTPRAVSTITATPIPSSTSSDEDATVTSLEEARTALSSAEEDVKSARKRLDGATTDQEVAEAAELLAASTQEKIAAQAVVDEAEAAAKKAQATATPSQEAFDALAKDVRSLKSNINTINENISQNSTSLGELGTRVLNVEANEVSLEYVEYIGGVAMENGIKSNICFWTSMLALLVGIGGLFLFGPTRSFLYKNAAKLRDMGFVGVPKPSTPPAARPAARAAPRGSQPPPAPAVAEPNIETESDQEEPQLSDIPDE